MPPYESQKQLVVDMQKELNGIVECIRKLSKQQEDVLKVLARHEQELINVKVAFSKLSEEQKNKYGMSVSKYE